MGASAARITAADFVTPAELCDRQLAAEGAGRIGGVRLELTGDAAVPRLTGCYQQVPLRVLPAFHFGAGQPALVYLLNPTAGLMDGDAQLVCFHAGRGTRAMLVGQSATRIHPCLQGFSTQQWYIQVDRGAVLVILPGPTIPFQDCRYYQRVEIELEVGANLIWGDIWLAGRYAYGATPEQFRFATVIQELAIRREQMLVFRDRFCWRGPWDRETAAWHFGSDLACGSLYATGPVQEHDLYAAPLAKVAHFATAHGDTCVRWSGTSESIIAAVVRSACCLASRLAGDTLGRPWLLAGQDLAPNHWFSAPSSHTPSIAACALDL